MTLPNSGLIKASEINQELERAYNARFNINGTPERTLAGVPSGHIKFSDFHGKTNEVVKFMSGGSGRQDLSSFFSLSEWQSGITKRVVLNQSNERGLPGHSNPVVACVPNNWSHGGWGGDLIFDIEGTISGAGGDANGGTGGRCLDANIRGANNQKVIINVLPTGVVRAGGGGGGKGGDGGGGLHQYDLKQPPSGFLFDRTSGNETYLRIGSIYDGVIFWKGVNIGSHYTTTSVWKGGWLYVFGAKKGQEQGNQYWEVRRQQPAEDTTYGGNGGDGGRGQGYNVSRAFGQPGTSGGPMAGGGGDGGRGGDWAASGAAGSRGANGNRTNGQNGASGGQPGFATVNEADMTLTINGTVIGRRS